MASNYFSFLIICFTLAMFKIALQGPISCSSAGDGVYENPSDCNKYIQCNGGSRYDMSCPGKLAFNKYTKECDYPANMQCFKVPFAGCSSTGDESHPNPSDCNKYIQCYKGKPYDMSCPDGLIFNLNTKMCDMLDKTLQC
ncbi:probable endochitinase [Exaiptasia diaphana]|uniref:Chitin-binding type-2 domain-containing protein n=1 Tax=Exaiptasia diaphana TaxID=2652724 RepID=A0A913YTR1_EXADI|nr:probable endochitinase [Exaiptasia diaphana]